MKLLLTSDVDGVGLRGDVVDVSDGYGRNYLLPQQLAIKATPGSVRNAERIQKARQEADHRAQEEAEDIARALTGTHIVIAAQAGDEGKLFGSVGASDVVAGIKKFTGIEVDRRKLVIDEPIRSIGLHGARLNLHREVEVVVVVDVIPA
ncbi:MAG: 50S ribosomal protein L9 [Acidimicrobiia bacterium]